MTRKYFIFTLAILALSTFRVDAERYSYKCTVKNELYTNNNGDLIKKYQLYANSIFNVDRKSGVVLGDTLGNSSYKTRIVIDPGSKQSSFKLLWSNPVKGVTGGINSVYLSVAEFNDNNIKPFILVISHTVLSGTCE